MLRLLTLFLALTLGLQGRAAPCELTDDVPETLKRCIPGIQVKATSSAFPDGKRKYYEVLIEQPVDHFRPKAGTFRQKLILAHRGYDEPLVLQTSGYLIFQVAPTMLAVTFDANQLQVEHRYFSGSAPAAKDWAKLDIRQSAADFHRITTAFKEVYRKAWVNTGASKGGMTSIYHRRFYAADLDGTLADVAPHSANTFDPRYVAFIDNVGGEKYRECRGKLETLQRHLLGNREKFQALVQGTFTHLGGVEVAFEHAVQEMTFYFWQYKSPENATVGCHRIPGPGSPDSDVMQYLKNVADPQSNYGDEAIHDFMPYFYQAATELGSPAVKRSHLEEWLKFPFIIDQYTPKGVSYQYTDAAMKDVGAWVKDHGERLMLTYGELDPWTAGMFPAKTSDDCHWNMVPRENHRASIFYLPAEQKKAALEIVSRWMGKRPVTVREGLIRESLDTLEFEYRSRTGRP